MKRALALVSVLLAGQAAAAPLNCTQDADTKAALCYDPKELRANGEIRAFKLYRGGPKGIQGKPADARFYCDSGILELFDRVGGVILREQPQQSHVVELRGDVCKDKAARPDKSLK